jgi:putative phage-type endonuclease
MITVTEDQRTDEWLQARAGKVTASRFKDVISRTAKGLPTADRTRYLWQIVTERLTGQPVQMPDAAPLRWGRENEDAARTAYLFTSSARLTETGFVAHPTLACGASPDGLVSDESDPDGMFGLIEIKCPWSSQVHLEAWLNGMPEDHQAQIQGQMWLTGRQWCDFVSFDPRMPADLQLYVQRVKGNPEFQAMLEREIIAFSAEADEIVSRLRAKVSF